jgi:hypothetical protein
MAGGGENLARIEQARGIEDALEIALQVDELGGLLESEIRRLEHTDAVLAAERAAHRHHLAECTLVRCPIAATLSSSSPIFWRGTTTSSLSLHFDNLRTA